MNEKCLKEWINDSMTQWLNDSMTQWLNDSMTQWINESMNQWINESWQWQWPRWYIGHRTMFEWMSLIRSEITEEVETIRHYTNEGFKIIYKKIFFDIIMFGFKEKSYSKVVWRFFRDPPKKTWLTNLKSSQKG